MSSTLSIATPPFGNLFNKLAVTTNQTDRLLHYSHLLTRTLGVSKILFPNNEFNTRTARYADTYNQFQTTEYAWGIVDNLTNLGSWRTQNGLENTSNLTGIIAELTCWVPYLKMLGLVTLSDTQTIGNLAVYGARPFASLGMLANLRVQKTLDVIGIGSLIISLCLAVKNISKKSVQANDTASDQEIEARNASLTSLKVTTVYFGLVFSTLLTSWNRLRPCSALISSIGAAAACFGLRSAWKSSEAANAAAAGVARPARAAAARPARAAAGRTVTVWNSAAHYLLSPFKILSQLRKGPDGQDKLYKTIKNSAVLLSLYHKANGKEVPEVLNQISSATGAASGVINSFIAFGRLNELNLYNEQSALNKALENGSTYNWMKVITPGFYGVNKLAEAAIQLRNTHTLQYASELISRATFGSVAQNMGQNKLWSKLEIIKDSSTTIAASADLYVKTKDLKEGRGDAWENKVAILGNIQKLFLSQYKRIIEPVVKPLVPKQNQWMLEFVLPSVGLFTALTLGYKTIYKAREVEKKAAAAAA